MGSLGGGMRSVRLGADPFDSAGATPERPSFRELYAARARQFVPALVVTDANIFFEDFDHNFDPPPGWNRGIAGSGSNVLSTSINNSALITSGVTIGSRYRLSNSGGFNINAANSALSQWYFAGRFMTPVPTVNAAAVRGFGIANGALNQTIMAGVLGAGSASHYVVQYNGNEAGAFIDLLVNIDGATVHVIEVYHLGDGILRARIDGGPELTGSGLNANPIGCGPLIDVYNAAAATNEQLDIDAYICMVRRL